MVQWDPAKASENRRKHGVDFADAVLVLEDPLALTRRDVDESEERWVTVGTDALGRALVVVYTWREGEVGMISARRATRAERRQYETHR